MNKAIFSSVLKMDGGGAGKRRKLKIIFKLADRMRSIRTTGASKNRDCSRFSRFFS